MNWLNLLNRNGCLDLHLQQTSVEHKTYICNTRLLHIIINDRLVMKIHKQIRSVSSNYRLFSGGLKT